MTNVERATSLVCFHDRSSPDDLAANASNFGESLDYLQARERAERAAARSALSIKARQVHQELARHYAEKVRGNGTGS